ncbi:MAG: tetratricopeptide repeat protein [Candidatus Omnitrophica bacterium]|nr:tetratricopeptide repeat protein [Candidatus Omnitrophota bacterium]
MTKQPFKQKKCFSGGRQWINFVFNRVIVLCLLFYVISKTFIPWDYVVLKAKLVTLSRLMPASWELLVRATESKETPEPKELDRYVHYLEEIIEALPNRPDSYGMLAYCRYLQGQVGESKKLYNKASDLKPDFFWFNYNLGVIHFKSKEYPAAFQFMVKALDAKKRETLRYTLNSRRIYVPFLISGAHLSPEYVLAQMRFGYENDYKVVVMSLYAMDEISEMVGYANSALREDIDDYAFFHFYLGLAQYKVKSYKLALQSFRTALRYDPYHYEALYYSSLIMQAVGKPQVAHNFLEQSKIHQQSVGSRVEKYHNIDLAPY